MPETAIQSPSPKKPRLNRRRKALVAIVLGALALVGVFVWGMLLGPDSYGPDYGARRLAPGFGHPFGTDNLGRDMFHRTIAGLSLSIRIGLLSAGISSVIALILGSLSAVFGGGVRTWLPSISG